MSNSDKPSKPLLFKLTKLSEIRENPNNPRTIKEDKFEKLVRSIQTFPEMLEARPIVVNPDMVVLGGNMRLKACKAAGLTEAPVYVASWEESKANEFIVKDNVGFGEWDWDILANEWDAVELEEWGLDVWTPEEEPTEGLTDPDEVSEAPEEPKTKLGDLYILGEHRLLCGDSTKAEDVEKLMNGEKATLIHADPPYGMGKEKDGVLNDNLYREKLDKFQMDWWQAFRPHINDNASAYIWGNAPDLWRLWYKGGLGDFERMTVRNEIVWDKPPGSGMKDGVSRCYGNNSERCLFFMLGEQTMTQNKDQFPEQWRGLLNYFLQEKEKMQWTTKQVIDITGKTTASHYFTESQFMLPTNDHYEKMQRAAKGQAFLRAYDTLSKEGFASTGDGNSILSKFYKSRAYFDNTHDSMKDVWQFGRVTGHERHGHATPKPVEMMERVMKSSSQKNDIVVEPFLGSGSTLMGAEVTDRKCYGMELDPKYCDVIVKRWEDFTGKKAELWKP
jgi:DNA modification methylase